MAAKIARYHLSGTRTSLSPLRLTGDQPIRHSWGETRLRSVTTRLAITSALLPIRWRPSFLTRVSLDTESLCGLHILFCALHMHTRRRPLNRTSTIKKVRHVMLL